MRRSASEIINELEMRIARLERQASNRDRHHNRFRSKTPAHHWDISIDPKNPSMGNIQMTDYDRQPIEQRMEENYRDSDENVLFVSNSLNKLLERKGLHTDLVAERGQGVSILIDNSLGNAMEKLQGIRFGIKWFGDDKLYHLGTMWFLSENRDGDIILSLNK